MPNKIKKKKQAVQQTKCERKLPEFKTNVWEGNAEQKWKLAAVFKTWPLTGGGSRGGGVNGWTKPSGRIHKERTRCWHRETAQELRLRGSVCTQPVKHAESAVLMCASGVGGDEFSSVCQTTRVSLALGHGFSPLRTPSLSCARTSRSGTCLSPRYTYFLRRPKVSAWLIADVIIQSSNRSNLPHQMERFQ